MSGQSTMAPAAALAMVIGDLVDLMTPEQRAEAAARVNAHSLAPGINPGIAKIYRDMAKSIDEYTEVKKSLDANERS